MVPITSQPPAGTAFAIEVPDIEKLRAASSRISGSGS
jgi:hypothetical protein